MITEKDEWKYINTNINPYEIFIEAETNIET